MRRKFARFVIMCASVLLCPSVVFAQASIAGVVRDTSSAVLPGVTVEASSPALIEKTRSVVTDGTGQYKIVDLRSGTYTVTFTLPGFNTFKREGIELTGSFVATVNADMRVGAIEESITVTGETPVVDIQTTKTQAVLGSDVLLALPTGRNYENLHVLVPGVYVPSGSQDVAGANGAGLVHFAAHGGDVHDSHVLVNGLSVAAPQQNGGRTMYVPNAGSSQEVVITTAGGLGENDTAGVVVNMVYKDGGNTFKGSLFATGATEGWSSNNYDQTLKDAGLKAPNTLKNVYDYEFTLGGPIVKDKLWFYGGSRWHGDTKFVAGMFYNKNAGDITKWTYDPDTSRQAINDEYWLNGSLRLTWQATPRNKIAAYYEDAIRCTSCNYGGSSTSSPETSGHGATHPDGLSQITWSSPVSNRVLLEAGFSFHKERWGSDPRSDFNPALIAVSAQNSSAAAAAAGLIPGLSYRAPGSLSKAWIGTYASRASLTYTSGAHSMKFGYNGEAFNYDNTADRQGFPVSYRLTTSDATGVPNQLTENAWPFDKWSQLNGWGLYAQDLWTINRLTLGLGLRYDRFDANFPEGHVGPELLVPVQIVIPAEHTTGLNDITPRMSAAYDLFGNGKTAIKVSFGKYMLLQSSEQYPLGGKAAPMARIPGSFNRSWTDSNKNFYPDCDLLNLASQNLASKGGDICGPASDQNFGKLIPGTARDPNLFFGWGNRPYNYEFDVSVQRELMPRLSVNAGYFRRWFGNFVVTQNRALTAADYQFFDFPVPNDPRLPISGVVTGFFDVNSAPGACGNPAGCFGLSDNYYTKAGDFGNQIQHWNGVDFSVNARLRDVLVQGGVSTGRESRDICEVAAKLPSVLLTANLPPGAASAGALPIPMQYCHIDGKFQTQVKLLGSYTVPRIAVQLAGTLQSIPGQEIYASYAAPNSVIKPLLGRDLAGGGATTTLNLLPPLTNFSDRVNQLDIRASKIFKLGARRAQVSLDLFNALNANTIQTYNSSYNPTGAWRIPTATLPPRLAKLSAQFDF